MRDNVMDKKQMVIKLLKHKDLGIMLGLGIVFLGLSVWSYFFVVLFLFCFMEWFDMTGYKFLACNGNVDDYYPDDPQSTYRERPLDNLMSYRLLDALTGAVILVLTLALVYLWYGLPEVVYISSVTLLWYFCGVKDVFYYNPVDRQFLQNQNVYWYSFTFYGFIQYTLRGKTMSGKDALWQALIGIAISIIGTILYLLL